MKYTVDYFIEKFSAIPAKKWTVGKWEHRGKRCVDGHCNATSEISTPESNALNMLFSEYLGVSSIAVNDAQLQKECIFLGTSPKKRVMTALLLIKAGVKY